MRESHKSSVAFDEDCEKAADPMHLGLEAGVGHPLGWESSKFLGLVALKPG